jgi:CheY-like chemotaxis protein
MRERRSGLAVLLVEDNPDHALLTRIALERREEIASVQVCEDVRSALDRLARDPLPDALLVDLRLPREGGLDLLAHLKTDSRTRELPVVMLSTSPREDEISQSLRLGAAGYLTKPIDVEAFLTRVRQG